MSYGSRGTIRPKQNQSCCVPKALPLSRRDHQGAMTLHEIGKGYTHSGFALAQPFRAGEIAEFCVHFKKRLGPNSGVEQ